MKPYDAQKEYLSWYFPQYRHVMVVRGFIPVDWIEDNLDKSMTSEKENCMGQIYHTKIVGYGIAQVEDDSDERFYLWRDKNHFDKVAAAFADQIVTLNPFGPEVCPHCGLTP